MKNVIIYTDGSCVPNPGVGGYGAILIWRDNVKRIKGGFKYSTNNRMELYAAIFALSELKEPCNVTLYSDSEYLVNTMTKNWRKKKNVDLWQKLIKLGDIHNVKYVWLRGHNGNGYNEECDNLAENGRLGELKEDLTNSHT